MTSFVDVAVPVGVRKTFAYSVPPRLRDRMKPGVRVLVPFGPRVLTGVIVRLGEGQPPGDLKLRPVRGVLDNAPSLPPEVVETALWVAGEYFTPPGEVLRAALPPGTEVQVATRVWLSPRAQQLLTGGLRSPSLGHQENALLEAIRVHGTLTIRELSDRSGVRDCQAWIEKLAASGWVRTEESVSRPRVSEKTVLGVRARPSSSEALARITDVQRNIYERLRPGAKAVPLHPLLRSARASMSPVRALERKGLVEIERIETPRTPLELEEKPIPPQHRLTAAQQQVFESVREALLQDRPQRFLIHGVTGSGKTEIYLRLIAEVLKRGQAAIFLVPEIGLTPLLSRLAHSHFPERVALLHSGMSGGERLDQWNRIRSGEAKVVVGTRSAVFAPVDNLKLVILDEEHDDSYKQDESPHYHARAVAWHRLQKHGGVLLLGSATPAVETFHLATCGSSVGYHCLAERIHRRPMPQVEVVDMNLEFQRFGRQTVLSGRLKAEIAQRLEKSEQVIVLLNRRGYSRSLMCRTCGHVFACADCSVSMTYHQAEHRIICHYCGRQENPPARCTLCSGEYIYYTGVGSEQLEEILRKTFPRARLARVDRDTTRRRGVLARTLLAFRAGELDLLLGTQILAKGHDFPNVTLVGVISADGGLVFPDFRAAERTFQLLTQVAGRAGRGTSPGKVVLQAFYPDHYALRFAKTQDYRGFFEKEIQYRKWMTYPPFTRLIQILTTESSAEKGLRLADKVAREIKETSRRKGWEHRVRVLGPAAAPLEKLKGRYRFQILLKAVEASEATAVLSTAFDELGRHRVALKNVSVDVDPVSLM